jgi:hypothetical protein
MIIWKIVLCNQLKILLIINKIPVIRYLALRVTPIFTGKIHALNTLKMGPLLRSNVMLS